MVDRRRARARHLLRLTHRRYVVDALVQLNKQMFIFRCAPREDLRQQTLET